MPVDRLTDPSGAQAVQAVLFDVGGKDMDDVVTINDLDKEDKDISFILFVSLWPSLLHVPLLEPLVIVSFPMLVGFFQVSCMHLAFCKILPSLLEYFKLFLIVMANFLIFSHNPCQSLRNEEEFLSSQ